MHCHLPGRFTGPNHRALFVLLVAVGLVDTARGGDWPQILGPSRNGIADGEKLLDAFPADGPKGVWEREVGEGLAGVAVVGQTTVLFHRLGDQEVVEALDARTGKSLWKQGFPASYRGSINPDSGPRCVPVIHKDQLFLFGAAGNLHCLGLKDGKPRWSRNAYEEFGGDEGYFGAGSTPIVEQEKLLVNVGGKKAGIVAFRISDGKTAWQSTDEGASYSSPVAVTLDGVRHVIFVTRLNAVSINPETGAVRFKSPFGARGPTVNGASPLVFDGHLFLSASYGIGAMYGKIGPSDLKQIWSSNDVMSSQYATCVFDQGVLFGVDGREDQGVARLRCFDPETGNVRWQKDGFGMATPILADGKLVLLKTDGTLVLVAASPAAYRELGRAKLFETTTRPLPALASGMLYARDTRVLKCIDLRK